MKQAQREKLQDATEQCSRITQHNQAYGELETYVQKNVVQSQGAEGLTSLHKMYMQLLGDKESTYSAQSLQSKILSKFPSLKASKVSNKQGTVIHHNTLSPDEANGIAFCNLHQLKQTALYLRSLVLQSMNNQSETVGPISAESLATPKTETPSPLLDFFKVLFSGSEKATDQIKRQTQSVADDVVYITTRGRTKPPKHICLGLSIKSLTGSRRIIEILNRLGHSINYHLVESYETELATIVSSKEKLLPDGLFQESGLCTAVAFDNYVENCETLSGGGTLRDTVGICYQNLPLVITGGSEAPNLLAETHKRSRSFQYQERSLEPYRKKPKMSTFSYEVTEVPTPRDLAQLEHRDILWMMSMALMKTPMWSGWNSLVTEDYSPQQKVLYLENITLPPTRNDVVLETMKMSQQIARECGEEFMIVHYDLAIAKPALQIQSAEAPRFDNLFIAFGPFHITLAYFGALGYLIDGSGGPEILVESGVLASGSLNGFLSGKHYNRWVG